MNWKFTSPAIALILLTACQLNSVDCNQECQDFWLDGPNVNDTADLVSTRIANPNPIQKEKRVIIACHGFTATSFEWQEFANYSQLDTSILVSRILLGGHGTDIQDFENTTWPDWGKPILTEYLALVSKGYKHISLIGSSTSGTLLMQDMHDRAFDTAAVKPEHVFLVDPFIVPVAKLLTMIKIVGPVLGNSPNDLDSTEKRHWYTNRPADQLEQLYDLANLVKNELEDGFNAPAGTKCRLWKSDGDHTADPVGALLIYKGLRHADGSHIEVEMVHSPLHVFTQLQGRAVVTAADTALQLKTFKEIDSLIKR